LTIGGDIKDARGTGVEVPMKIVVGIFDAFQVAKVRMEKQFVIWPGRRFVSDDVTRWMLHPIAAPAGKRAFNPVFGMFPGRHIQLVTATERVMKRRTEIRPVRTEVLPFVFGAMPNLGVRVDVSKQRAIGHFRKALPIRHPTRKLFGYFFSAKRAWISLGIQDESLDGGANLAHVA